MQQKNYYILLGVHNTVSFEELRSAYRELAKKHHPDKNPNNKVAEEYFKEIQEAYATLSNPEKRKKYDIFCLFGKAPSQQRPNNGNSAAGTTNAKPKPHNQNYGKQKNPGFKQDKTENYQIPLSIGIALLLLYFIISYSSNKTTIRNETGLIETENNVDQEQVALEQLETKSLISEFASPYCNLFGEEKAMDDSKNSIIIHNGNSSEVIICLVENKNKKTTIRNQYMDIGSTFKMNNIPNGEYFLKVYYGTVWDTTKTFLNNTVKGGFTNELGFAELKMKNGFFKMQQEQTSSCASFSTYEIGLNPSQIKDIKKITAEQFFK